MIDQCATRRCRGSVWITYLGKALCEKCWVEIANAKEKDIVVNRSNPWVLIDVSWLAHRALYTNGDLSNDDMPTGVIFGFFEQLHSICTDPRVRSSRVALFFDSRKSLRREAFPGYKQSRDEKNLTRDEIRARKILKRQVTKLRRRVLPESGFPCYLQTGLESDDLIASAAETATGPVVIVTADGDLYQCITDSVHFFNPGRDVYMDAGEFTARKKVAPPDWGFVKCVAGCSTDDVPGVPGVGEKSVIDYIWKLLPKKGKRFAAIESKEGQRTIKRNRPLVVLPHASTKPVALVAPKYNPEAFFRWCKKLGMRSYLRGQRRLSWEAFFAGRVAGPLSTPRRPGESRK